MRARATTLRSRLAGLARRARLTLRYLGWRTFVARAVTFPLRPIARRLGYGTELGPELARARSWYRREGRQVTVVIPSFGPPDLALQAARTVRRTTDRRRVRILVVDDASAARHRERLRHLRGAELIEGPETVGFAGNANRGLRAADPAHDVVLLNSDVLAHRRGWLEALQHALDLCPRAGVAGAKLLYPDGQIQFAGTVRNPGAPDWFDHRFRFKPSTFGPSNVGRWVLGVTGACMYLRREALDEVGLLDEGYGMAFEDIDWCLRAWESGWESIYVPHATLTHLESKTRGMEQGARELASQGRFWDRWGEWFDAREVRDAQGRLRIVYVTHDTGVGGGHRVVFEHLNRLADRGHAPELWTLTGGPDWFDLRVPVRSFPGYDEMLEELRSVDAIKVATWWETADVVGRASLTRGLPAYFVQDIETSYYPDDGGLRNRVLASYAPEFAYLTTSGWNADELRGMGYEPAAAAPGVDTSTFRDLEGVEREADVVLAVGRTNPLKNFPLTEAAYLGLPEPRPQLWLFGVEPELAERTGARYFEAPSDAEVNELYNRATVFLQTSAHEGFCLPIVEAMAAGCPVVCTDAHGNRDFCRDGDNCLMVEPDPDAVGAGVSRLLAEPALRARLAEGGRRTALSLAWEAQGDRVADFVEGLAAGSRRSPTFAAQQSPGEPRPAGPAAAPSGD